MDGYLYLYIPLGFHGLLALPIITLFGLFLFYPCKVTFRVDELVTNRHLIYKPLFMTNSAELV